jgi:hypothetical protein
LAEADVVMKKYLKALAIVAPTLSLILFMLIRNITISAIIIGAPLLSIFYLKRARNPSVRTLLLVTHVMELLAAAYALSGSLKQSISQLCRIESPVSGQFRSALLRIRSGVDPAESLKAAFQGNPWCSEWLESLLKGSVSDAQDLFSAWSAKAEEVILKVDDLLSFVIVFSTILPVIFLIILMVSGVEPPLIYLLVVFQLTLFQGVYHWIKGLLSLLY